MQEAFRESPQNSAPQLIAREQLSPELVREFESYLQNLPPTERINQLQKINSELKELSEAGIAGDELSQEFKTLLLAIQNTSTLSQKTEIEGQKTEVVEKTEVEKEKKTELDKTKAIEQKNLKTQSETDLKFLLERQQVLKSQISALTGKSPQELIPGYATEVEKASEELKKQGKNPALAETVVLLSHENAILKSVPPNKTDELAQLRASFGELRSLAGTQGLPNRAPAVVALSDPSVSLDAYSKIKAGFEPPTQTVYTSKAGELISQASRTGERTIMNREGNRFREKDGLRIESPAFVPDSLVQTELSGKELQAERLGALLPKRSSELAERLWQITPELAPRVLASLSQGEEARGKSREALLKFGQTLSNPSERTLFERNVLELFDGYQKQLAEKTRLEQDIQSLRKRVDPEFVRQSAREQDSVVDGNLQTLSKVGMPALGQAKYEELLYRASDTLTKRFSLPGIDPTKPFTQRDVLIFQKILAVLGNVSEKDLYENGGLSKKAIAGIDSGKPTVEQAVEAVFSTTKQSDQPEPQLQGRV